MSSSLLRGGRSLLASSKPAQQQQVRKFLTGPNNSSYAGNTFRRFILKYGDRPMYLQRMLQKAKFWPIALLFALPLIITPLYVDFFVQYDRVHGNRKLKEYEESRKETKGGHHHAAASAAAASEEGEEIEEVAHSAAPEPRKDLKPHYKYVLIGGGTASHAAMKEILKRDPNAEILILSEESNPPYERPPLSKELWTSSAKPSSLKYMDWRGKEADLFYEDKTFYESGNVKLALSTKVAKLDVNKRCIVTEDGTEVRFDRCLLATGGTPRVVPGYHSFPDRVGTFRNVDDFQKLESATREGGQHVVIVGGSFLGTELAYSLASRDGNEGNKGCTVTQVYMEPVPMSRNLPRYLSQTIKDKLEQAGVRAMPNRNVAGVELDSASGNRLLVRLDNGEAVEADFVLTATGIFPNTELAESAGLEIDPMNGGIMTNAELEARNGIFVAGDVLSYHDTALGRRRVEHYEHAESTGRLAGRNMASALDSKTAFKNMSMFWSDIGPEIHFEAVGDINSSLNTYAVWNGVSIKQNGAQWNAAPATPQVSGFRKGVVYYMRDSRVVGCLLWNMGGKSLSTAREIVSKRTTISDTKELDDLIKLD